MSKVVHIVGCGTLGANLCLSICKLALFEKVHIYDYDVVTYSEEPEFPFNSASGNLPKVEALELLLHALQLDFTTEIYTHRNKVINDITDAGIVIDCRDYKLPKLRSELRLSIDGSLLFVDCRNEFEPKNDYCEYAVKKNYVYIDLAVSLVCNLIDQTKYTEDCFWMYDLSKVLSCGKKLTM